MSDMKTRPAPASAGESTLTYADAYRLPSDPYALAVLTMPRARRELGQVAPNAWKHERADGRVVTITVPGRD